VGVTDAAGESAVYTYDAVGNLLSIDRRSTATVSIIEFTPSGGPIGTSIIIYGTGFSSTPGENTVTFNGVGAAVTSAAATQMTATVPAGAVTGPIAVTSPSGSATSSTAFEVTNAAGAPIVSSFSPGIGMPGDALAIDGQNFDVAAFGNNVKVNVRGAPIESTSGTTHLNASIPAQGTSGRIRVTTAAGTGISTGDLFVPPAPYTPTDVAYTTRMAPGDNRTATIGVPNRIGLLIFDGTGGQRISVGLSAGPSAEVKILKPDGAVLKNSSTGAFPNFVDVTMLPTTGTYTIVLDPFSNGTGSVTVTLYNVPNDVSASILPDGDPVSVPISAPGQNGRLPFQGTAGQRISAKATVTSGSFGGCSWTLAILAPDGSTVGSVGSCGTSAFLEPVVLPVSGTYTYVIDPFSSNTGTASANLYNVVDLIGSISPDGSALSVNLGTPGQNARLTFEGTIGQRISAKTTVTAGAFGGCSWTLAILAPGGGTVGSVASCGTTAFLEPVVLPASGTYTYLVDPLSSNTGTGSASLYVVAADLTGSIGLAGSPVAVSLGSPGQNARLAFEGTASQRVSAKTTVNSGSFGCAWTTTILKPDGSALGSAGGCSGTVFLEPLTLPVSGTYTYVIDPAGSSTGEATAAAYDVVDVTGTLTVGDPAVPVSLTTPGQNATLTFSATAGQQATVRISSNAINGVTVKLLNPSGVVLTSVVSSAASFNLSTQTLPVSGTYTVLINPVLANTGSISVRVTNP
jgi:YD repeat-containing protein